MGSLAQDAFSAAVLFYDESQHWSRRLLRPGFRHCDVVLQTSAPGLWVAAVGKIGGMIAPLALVDFDPETFARGIGAEVVLLPCYLPACRRSPVMLSTCVGVAKAALGIRQPWIITPWQLYRWLKDR